ncbi:MAG: tetratricopeptide repeat protein, partial [Promethearchaeota archaeon]
MQPAAFLSESTKSIEDLIKPNKQFTVIAGAGVSMDEPSCLLSAKQIVGHLVELYCPKEEANKIKELNGLRYEIVIEAIEKHVDKDLNFMNFFETFEKPNLNHMFIARLLTQGMGDVVTTNFDYLIEYALIDVIGEDRKDKIMPVITRKDFGKFESKADINLMKEKGFFPVCKIHGSKKNLITGENTRESLITTMSDLGKDREGMGTFTVEPYKRPYLVNITENKSILVMGYSGGDDFDIGPTLQELVDLEEIIWINHVMEVPAGGYKIFEVQDNVTEDILSKDIPQIDHVLGTLVKALRSKGSEAKVYRIDTTTKKLVKEYIWNLLFRKVKIPEFGPPDEDVKRIRNIIENLIGETPNIDIARWEVAIYIYGKLYLHEDALRCGKKLVELAEKYGLKGKISEGMLAIGKALGNLEQTKDSIQVLTDALNYADDETRGRIHNNLGTNYLKLSNFKEAIKNFRNAIKLAKKHEDKLLLADSLLSLGNAYYMQGLMSKSLGILNEALDLVDKIGDLGLKAVILSVIAHVKSSETNFSECADLHLEILKIVEILKDEHGIGISYGNVASAYLRLGDVEKAREYTKLCSEKGKFLPLIKAWAKVMEASILEQEEAYEKAIPLFQDAASIYKENYDMENLASQYVSLALCYKKLGYIEESVDYFTNALELIDETKNIFQKMKISLEFSDILYDARRYVDCIKHAKIGLNISEELVRMDPEAPLINNLYTPRASAIHLKRFIGTAYQELGEFENALEYYLEIYPIPEILYTQYLRARLPYSIAFCYRKTGRYNSALDYLEKGTEYANKIEDETKQKEIFQMIYREFASVYRLNDDYEKAIKYILKAKEINEQLYEELKRDDDLRDVARCLNDLALIHDKQNKIDDAIKEYLESIDLMKKVKNYPDIAATLDNIALLFYERDRYIEAQEYYERAANQYHEIGDTNHEMFELNMIGNCLYGLKKYEESIEYYLKTLEISKRINDIPSQRTYLRNIAGAYRFLKNEGEALKYYNKSIDLLDIIG